MFFPFTVLTPPFEYDVVHVQGYRCPLLSFFIGLGQGSMFLTYNEKNNSAVRTVIKTLSVSGSSVSGWHLICAEFNSITFLEV